MGTFQSNKCFNRHGEIRTSADNDIVDVWGNILGSPQFDSNKIVDMFGNLGKLASSGPWEIQKGTVETVGTDLSHNILNYVTPITGYAATGCTGYVDGVISGAGAWILQSSPQTIGGVSYIGFGLLIATANNTHTLTTMQTNTKLQLGADLNALTGTVRDVTLSTGAVLDIFGANTTRFNKVFVVTNNGGVVNWKSTGVCGEGILGNNGNYNNGTGITNVDDCMWALGTSMSGSGTINILEGGTFFNNGIQTVSGSNKFNINGCGWCNAAGVKQGAISINANTTFTQAINVQSSACIKTHTNSNAIFSGLITGSAPLTVGNLGTPVNGNSQFTNNGNTYSGTIKVDGTRLSLSVTAMQYATVNPVNGGYVSLNSATFKSLFGSDPTTYVIGSGNSVIAANGVTQFDGRLLWNGTLHNIYLNGGSANVLTLTAKGNTASMYPRNGSKLILQGATFTQGTDSQIRVSNGSTISAGTSTDAECTVLWLDATSRFEVRAVGTGCGLLTLNATPNFQPGWKVDLPDAMAAGVYTIIKNNAGASNTLPTIGINNTGRTVTGFSWNNAVSPKTLRVTLV